ncbi:MAG: Mut7-C ubiquitin/RNAse domain-containing protein [Candidatus Thiodiazotropha sp. (ex Codakia rugifera)]|nr:Mut7-C ubiquitin/RNAse domain-containing protein [Candidatus Thiodiazotropha sp. (ex Codakia rugifera)]
MPRVSLRFYEELNDFLPGSLRKCTFEKEFTETQSVKHLIENLGVPHTEVEIILVNGQSVDLSHPLREGDRISVYPMFELLDISPLLRLRMKPMRHPRFIADAHLGKLSRYLRLLGFDCLFFNDAGDRNLARISAEQGRVLLTRDRVLLMRRNITHGCFIHATEPRQQLMEIVQRLQLEALYNPFTRCMACNSQLTAVEKKRIEDELPDSVRQHYNDFWRCNKCGRVYWKGSHYRELRVFIDTLVLPVTKQ